MKRDVPTDGVYRPHLSIHILGDEGFTAANGVINQNAAGTPDDPYVIEGWSVTTSFGGPAIEIRNTTKSFVVRNCLCFLSRSGIELHNVRNARLDGNWITGISGLPGLPLAGDGTPGVGIRVENSQDVSLEGRNRVSFVYGGAGGPGTPWWMKGGPGGRGANAYGFLGIDNERLKIKGAEFTDIFGAGGGPGGVGVPVLGIGGKGGRGGRGGIGRGIALIGGRDYELSDNELARVLGGISGAGASGFLGLSGGDGGDGGDGAGSVAIEFRRVLNLRVEGNSIRDIDSAWASTGGSGAVLGGNGGDGGNGGIATGILGVRSKGTRLRRNKIERVTSGLGAASDAGAVGIVGGRGGQAGAGGAAYGLHCIQCEDFFGEEENYDQIRTGRGAAGAIGGWGALGGAGGAGGDSGEAIGALFEDSPDARLARSSITGLYRGAPGWGGIGGLGITGFNGIGKNGDCRGAYEILFRIRPRKNIRRHP